MKEKLRSKKERRSIGEDDPLIDYAVLLLGLFNTSNMWLYISILFQFHSLKPVENSECSFSLFYNLKVLIDMIIMTSLSELYSKSGVDQHCYL